MLDYQRIVDDVRSALFNNGQDMDDFLRAAAGDYGLAIDEVNERLRQCGALLRKGLRSEAIQLCEVEPNPLDSVGILDFPERESWNELLTVCGYAPPAGLMLDVAAHLNEAYAVEQPLATLLQRHRLLAMAHGPLKLRLETLRGLAAADAENPIWDQDLRTFEAERIRQLQRELPQAIAAGDAAALDALAAELENAAWRVDRPEALIEQVAAARSSGARQQGLADLQAAADALNVAHAEFDVDGGRAVRGQWDQLFSVWGRFADPALVEGAGAAPDWLRDQDLLAEQLARHKEAAARLLQAVLDGRPAEELHRLHRDVKREGEIPASVEKRYRAALDALDRAARRSTRMAIGIFAAFILVTTAIIATVVVQHVRAGERKDEVDRDVAVLQRLVDDKNFDEAQRRIDRLTSDSPGVAADSGIQGIASQVKARLRDHDAFSKAMGLVQKSIADRLPDDDALEQAKKHVATDDENAAIGKVEEGYAKVRHDLQVESDRGFGGQLKALEDRVTDALKNCEENPDLCLDKLNHIEAALAKLLADSPQVSDAAKKRADALRTRMKMTEEETRTVGERLNCEEAVTAACGDNGALRKSLREYAEKFPLASRSAGFLKASGDESSLWDWIGRWNEIVQAVGERNCTTFNQKTAAGLAAKLQKLLDERPGYPDAEAFRLRLPYLEAVVHRVDGEGNPIEASLKPIFSDPLLAGVWMWKGDSGQRYYLLEDFVRKHEPIRESATYGLQYVVGFDLSTKEKSILGRDLSAGFAVAPQCATASGLLSILNATSEVNWETSFKHMIAKVVNDGDTDPLLKHLLLWKIVAIGCQGSLCLEKGFGRYAEILKNSTVQPKVNWVDPNDTEATEQRSIAEADLGKLLPGLAEAEAATDKQLRSLDEPIGWKLTCVGWLRRSMAGNWQCVTKPTCSESGKLVIVRADETAGRGENAAVFEAVGRIDDGKAAIKATASQLDLVEGRPVYVVVRASK